MNEIELLALLTSGGFGFMVTWLLSVERRIVAIHRELESHRDYMKSLDRQAGHALEVQKLQLGLTGDGEVSNDN